MVTVIVGNEILPPLACQITFDRWARLINNWFGRVVNKRSSTDFVRNTLKLEK